MKDPPLKILIFFKLLNKSDDDFVCKKEQRNFGILPNFKKDYVLTHTVYKEPRYNHIIK